MMGKMYCVNITEGHFKEEPLRKFVDEFVGHYGGESGDWDRDSIPGCLSFQFSTAKERDDFILNVIGVELQTVKY